MGNAPSSPVATCLINAVGGDTSLIATPDKVLYQLTDVKPYNLDIPVVPAAVTYPKNTQQVADIIKCASSANVKVQARCGGHSYGNYGLGGEDGALVIDMKNFQQFSMSSDFIATVGGGTLLADVTKRLHENGKRAMAHGTCPQVGIGGHATIGGLGPSSRMWGAALDHIVEAEVVLANSTIVRTSATRHPDLFFAIKGAAAGFGVITEFKFKTHPEPAEVVQYSYSLSFGKKADMAQQFKDWQAFIASPNLPYQFASQLIVHELGMILSGTFFGSKAEFDKLDLDSKFGKSASKNTVVLNDWLGIVSKWAEERALEIVGGIPSAFYSKSLPFTKNTLISNATVDALFSYFDTAERGTPLWFVIFDLEGGAINDVRPDSTAYGHRDALFYLQSYGVNLSPRLSDKTRNFITEVNRIIERSQPNTKFGAYAGYVDPALGQAGQEAYWGANLPRLERIKAQLDPNDLFHNPQSVRPARL